MLKMPDGAGGSSEGAAFSSCMAVRSARSYSRAELPRPRGMRSAITIEGAVDGNMRARAMKYGQEAHEGELASSEIALLCAALDDISPPK